MNWSSQDYSRLKEFLAKKKNQKQPDVFLFEDFTLPDSSLPYNQWDIFAGKTITIGDEKNSLYEGAMCYVSHFKRDHGILFKTSILGGIFSLAIDIGKKIKEIAKKEPIISHIKRLKPAPILNHDVFLKQLFDSPYEILKDGPVGFLDISVKDHKGDKAISLSMCVILGYYPEGLFFLSSVKSQHGLRYISHEDFRKRINENIKAIKKVGCYDLMQDFQNKLFKDLLSLQTKGKYINFLRFDYFKGKKNYTVKNTLASINQGWIRDMDFKFLGDIRCIVEYIEYTKNLQFGDIHTLNPSPQECQHCKEVFEKLKTFYDCIRYVVLYRGADNRGALIQSVPPFKEEYLKTPMFYPAKQDLGSSIERFKDAIQRVQNLLLTPPIKQIQKQSYRLDSDEDAFKLIYLLNRLNAVLNHVSGYHMTLYRSEMVKASQKTKGFWWFHDLKRKYHAIIHALNNFEALLRRPFNNSDDLPQLMQAYNQVQFAFNNYRKRWLKAKEKLNLIGEFKKVKQLDRYVNPFLREESQADNKKNYSYVVDKAHKPEKGQGKGLWHYLCAYFSNDFQAKIVERDKVPFFEKRKWIHANKAGKFLTPQQNAALRQILRW